MYRSTANSPAPSESRTCGRSTTIRIIWVWYRGIEMLPHHDAVGGYVCDHPLRQEQEGQTPYDSHTWGWPKKCTVRTSLHVRLQSKDVDSDSGRSHSDEWYRDTPTKLLRPDPAVHDMIHNLYRPDMHLPPLKVESGNTSSVLAAR
jgi:hypothetical protein